MKRILVIGVTLLLVGGGLGAGLAQPPQEPAGSMMGGCPGCPQPEARQPEAPAGPMMGPGMMGPGMMGPGMMGMMGMGHAMMGPLQPMMRDPEIMGTLMMMHGEAISSLGEITRKYEKMAGPEETPQAAKEMKEKMRREVMGRIGEVLLKYGQVLKEKAQKAGQ